MYIENTENSSRSTGAPEQGLKVLVVPFLVPKLVKLLVIRISSVINELKELSVTKQLTMLEERFCIAMMTAPTVSAAYKAAYHPKTENQRSISRNASEVHTRKHIQARLKEMREASINAATFTKADVLQHLFDLATANPNDLTQYRRVNCRHCNGKGFGYQWIDGEEVAAAQAKVIEHNAISKRKKEMPDISGGIGYRNNGEVHPDCPRCAGEGVGRVHFKDTRKLTGASRRLYAGVKQTKEGVEIKMRDQDAALLNLAKHFGLIGPDSQTMINVDNTITNVPAQALPTTPQEAAKAYQSIMQGKKK